MIEAFDWDRHSGMVKSWGYSIESDLSGSGLVEPGVSCVLSGVIGGSKMLYVYGAMANPSVSASVRAKSLIGLMRQTMKVAKIAGIKYAMAITSNRVVCRYLEENLRAAPLTDRAFEWQI